MSLLRCLTRKPFASSPNAKRMASIIFDFPKIHQMLVYLDWNIKITIKKAKKNLYKIKE